MFKTIERYVGIAKSKIRAFSREMQAAADDTGLNSVQSKLKDIAGSTNLMKAQGQKASSWGPLVASSAPVVSDENLDKHSEEATNGEIVEKTELNS